jgi:DNA polymerase III epsilon subunit-like protein
MKKELLNNTLVIDLETGGVNPKTDAICSVSVKKYGEGIVKTWYIKPYDKKYNDKAVQVHGLYEEYLEENGISVLEFTNQFVGFLYDNFEYDEQTKKFKQRIKLLGHNVKFDMSFLRKLLSLYDFYFSYHYKDTMIVAEFLRDVGLIKTDSLSLVEVYKYLFGEDNLTFCAHDSQADVLMTEKIYKYFIGESIL